MKTPRFQSASRRSFALAIAAGLCSGCIDVQPSEAEKGWEVYDEPTSPTSPTVLDAPAAPAATTGPYSCELTHSAFRDLYGLAPSFTEFTPNDGLLLVGNVIYDELQALSTTDGSPFDTTDSRSLFAVDSAWTVGAFVDYGEVHLRDLATREILATSGAQWATAAAVSPNGVYGAFVTCDQQTTSVELVAIPTRRSQVVELESSEQYCGGWGNADGRAEFTSDGRILALSSTTGRLYSLDTSTMEVRSVVAHQQVQDYAPNVIADMAVRPGSNEVVTTGADGVMRRWSLPELEQIGPDREVGAFQINLDAYAPHYTVSPLAFSPDGSTLAFIDVDRNIVLENSAARTVLETPRPLEFENEWREPNVPVTIAFSHRADRIGVGYALGNAIWGCPGGAIDRVGALAIDLPTTLNFTMGGSAQVPVAVVGAGPVVAVRVESADGLSSRYSDGLLTFWGQSAGEFDVTMHADDGLATASATIRVRFTEQ